MLFRPLTTSAARSARTVGQVRFASSLPVPPKVATPSTLSGPGGDSARMESVVNFYKSLPKGPAPKRRGGGIKDRYFDGKNASGAPIVATIGSLLLLGYTIDYHMHLSESAGYS